MYDSLKYDQKNENLLHISCVNALGTFGRSRIVDCWAKTSLGSHIVTCVNVSRKKNKVFLLFIGETTWRRNSGEKKHASDNAARYKSQCYLNV